MSRFHVYLQPFANDAGTAYGSWLEITKDVAQLGDLQQQLDNTEFDVGIFRVGNLTMALRNDEGKYSDVGGVGSIFLYKRSDTRVRITWEPGEGPLYPGFFDPSENAIISLEQTIFEGLLNDAATKSDIEDQQVDFQVLGYESKLAEIGVPESTGSALSSAYLLTLLNQDPFNALVTVSAANIVPGNDVTIDLTEKFLNSTVLNALKSLLVICNSVLYVRDGVVYVSSRAENPGLGFTFNGPGSLGAMNISKIQKFSVGSNRVVNHVPWRDTDLLAQNTSSKAKWGTRLKEINQPSITTEATRQSIIDAVVAEFGDPKREMDLVTPIEEDRIGLFLLDQVSVDFPGIPLRNEAENVAVYGVGTYGVDYYADQLYNLVIEAALRFKVMGRKISFKNETVTYSIREVG